MPEVAIDYPYGDVGQRGVTVPTRGILKVGDGVPVHPYSEALVMRKGSVYRSGRFLGYIDEIEATQPGDVAYSMRLDAKVGQRYIVVYTPAEGPCP